MILIKQSPTDGLSAALKACKGDACVVDSCRLLVDYICELGEDDPLPPATFDIKRAIQAMTWSQKGLPPEQVDILASTYPSIESIFTAIENMDQQQPGILLDALSAVSAFLEQDFYLE
jgi:hypothetical protein